MPDAILIGYDGSPAAARAIRAARELLSAPVAIVATVWEPALPAFPTILGDTVATEALDPRTAEELDERSQDRGRSIAEHGAQLAQGLGFATEAVVVPDERNVAETLADLAAQRQVEAIVVGSRGHSALRERLLGSTSSGLLHRAACPVLVVPRDGDTDRD